MTEEIIKNQGLSIKIDGIEIGGSNLTIEETKELLSWIFKQEPIIKYLTLKTTIDKTSPDYLG